MFHSKLELAFMLASSGSLLAPTLLHATNTAIGKPFAKIFQVQYYQTETSSENARLTRASPSHSLVSASEHLSQTTAVDL